jgi:FtsP/CotA-like multicopper oxidase with cupredoxin domain
MRRFTARFFAVLLLLSGLPDAVRAANVNYTLYINSGTLSISGTGGTNIAVWSYTDVSGTIKVPGPVLTAREGDAVSITVVNNHSSPHNFVIQGVTSDTAPIASGGSKTYSFTAPAAGTFVYHDTLNSNVNRAMGMYGMLWVAPADGGNTAWTGGPGYTFQRTWVVSEMDKPRWNDVAAAGGTVNTAVYKPNYFLMNGMGGFQAMSDPATTIVGAVGQTALVRLVNGGQFSHSLHFHGNHVQVLTVNGVRQPSPYKVVDVVNLPPLGTMDVLFYLNQPGHYPMHIHTAQMETANGVYLNGVATMIMID